VEWSPLHFAQATIFAESRNAPTLSSLSGLAKAITGAKIKPQLTLMLRLVAGAITL
jgi:hypothetical protein